jgi:hypothetical protein
LCQFPAPQKVPELSGSCFEANLEISFIEFIFKSTVKAFN